MWRPSIVAFRAVMPSYRLTRRHRIPFPKGGGSPGCKKSRHRQPPTPVRERVANPRQGDFATPDWEMRRAAGDPPKGSTSYAENGSGLSRADDPIVLPGSL